MRIDRGLLNWGVFLIALGGVPLAVQQGWVDSSLTSDLWRLWPLILVGIGLGLILRWTPIAWLGGALVAATFGLIFGALLAGGITGISSACIGIGEDGETTSREGVAGGSAFSVDLTLSCGELTLTREAGATWRVDAVHGSDTPPTIDGSADRLSIDQRFEGDAFLVFTQETRNDWQVGVPADAALTLSMTLNAADADADLGAGPIATIGGTFNASEGDLDLSGSSAPVRARLDLTYNASSGTVALPSADLAGSVTLNASSLTICVPADADVRISHDGTLSSADFGSSGLQERDGVWSTPPSTGAVADVSLDIESTVSSLSVVTREECG